MLFIPTFQMKCKHDNIYMMCVFISIINIKLVTLMSIVYFWWSDLVTDWTRVPSKTHFLNLEGQFVSLYAMATVLKRNYFYWQPRSFRRWEPTWPLFTKQVISPPEVVCTRLTSHWHNTWTASGTKFSRRVIYWTLVE